jgi:hypothetical protein
MVGGAAFARNRGYGFVDALLFNGLTLNSKVCPGMLAKALWQ